MELITKNTITNISNLAFNGINILKKAKITKLKSDIFEQTNNQDFYISLSKSMAYALRHKPKECGLVIDEYGYTNLKDLLKYLNELGKFQTITRNDIEESINKIPKKRFEIIGDKIRAYYGHSFAEKLKKIAAIPQNILYHGTTHKALKNIKEEGLTHQKRQYVHLSDDINTAINVGQRRDNNPIILTIDTEQATKNGIKFYIGNQSTWLADDIPVEYITFPSNL